jgi:hypothetical protein
MRIKGKEYIISERSAADVLNLAEAASSLNLPEDGKSINEEQFKNAVLVGAQALNDSLKATYKRISWYYKPLFLRYRKFLDNKYVKVKHDKNEIEKTRKKFHLEKKGLNFILEYVTTQELFNSQVQLSQIDSKKKVQNQAGSQSAEKSVKV